MPMENQLAHAITQTEYDSSYDKAAKKLLANKQILAQIMKNCVNEYSACSVDEIAEKYIRKNGGLFQPLCWSNPPFFCRAATQRWKQANNKIR